MLLRSVGRGGAFAGMGAPQARGETVVETPFEAGGHVAWYGVPRYASG